MKFCEQFLFLLELEEGFENRIGSVVDGKQRFRFERIVDRLPVKVHPKRGNSQLNRLASSQKHMLFVFSDLFKALSLNTN